MRRSTRWSGSSALRESGAYSPPDGWDLFPPKSRIALPPSRSPKVRTNGMNSEDILTRHIRFPVVTSPARTRPRSSGKGEDVKRLILASLIFVASCASSITLDDSAKTSIKSISISEKVIVPAQAHFIGPGAAFGALGAIADSANDTPQAIKSHL